MIVTPSVLESVSLICNFWIWIATSDWHSFVVFFLSQPTYCLYTLLTEAIIEWWGQIKHKIIRSLYNWTVQSKKGKTKIWYKKLKRQRKGNIDDYNKDTLFDQEIRSIYPEAPDESCIQRVKKYLLSQFDKLQIISTGITFGSTLRLAYPGLKEVYTSCKTDRRFWLNDEIMNYGLKLMENNDFLGGTTLGFENPTVRPKPIFLNTYFLTHLWNEKTLIKKRSLWVHTGQKSNQG